MAFAYIATAYDHNDVPRCWGSSDISANEAEDQCKAAIMEYVRHRPDTGPVTAWHIEFSTTNERAPALDKAS